MPELKKTTVFAFHVFAFHWNIIKFGQMKGSAFFQGGIIAKIHEVFKKSSPESLGQSILVWREFKFVQRMSPTFSKGR